MVGRGNSASTFDATVGGGNGNSANGVASTIGGGYSNSTLGVNATIAGGFTNSANGDNTSIGGGDFNSASGIGSTIGGGFQNTASGNDATIAGGNSNNASGNIATVAGGLENSASGDYSAIAGGRGLTLDAGATHSFGFLADNFGFNNMTISEPNVAVFGNSNLWLANNNNTASQLRFYEASGSTGSFPDLNTFYTSFQAGDQEVDITYILPDSTLPVSTVEEGILQLDGESGQLSWVDPDELGGGNGWSLTGDTGTTPGTNFIGTIDNKAFEIHVYDDNATADEGTGRVARFEPKTGVQSGPNVILGYDGNSIDATVSGGTIAGGGYKDNENKIVSSG